MENRNLVNMCGGIKMNKSVKYGNNNYWCFIEKEWSPREVAIWKGPDGNETIIARACDKYEAKTIVDALLKHTNVEDGLQLNKKELAFLEFVCFNCVEPYATMASNAVLWKDREAYKDLRDKFPQIYS